MRGGGRSCLSAVAEEVRRVRDRRGEVDRRRDDVGGERQPDGGRHVEHPVGPAVVVVAEGPGQRDGVCPRGSRVYHRPAAEKGDHDVQDEPGGLVVRLVVVRPPRLRAGLGAATP